MNVAAAQHHVVGLKGGDQAFHNVSDITPPLLLAVLFQSSNANVVFEGGLLIGQVSQFHRLNSPIHDHRGPKACPQPKKEHFAAFVTSQSLHRGVVHHLGRAFERSLEVKPDPTFSQVPRFGNRSAPDDGARVADGKDVIFPVSYKLPYLRDHPLWGEG